MRKNVYGRKFSRDINERKALFKGLLTHLVLNGRIETTHQKAKAIKGDADRMVKKAGKEGQNARRLLEQDLFPNAIDKMINDIAPRFKNRPGGYTRIIKVGNRFADNGAKAIIEWVEMENITAAAPIKADKNVKTPKKAPVAKKQVKEKPKKTVGKVKNEKPKK
jgi:large subunit ribosomal protein L17